MKEFFKDVLNFVRDMPQVVRWLLVGFFTICIFLILKHSIKLFYNKDKVKLTFIPIIAILILAALTIFLCAA